MKKRKGESNDSAKLRQEAEKKLKKQTKEAAALGKDELRELIQESRLQKIELEMQNEELRSMQDELTEMRDRYFDLYDNAPVGYIAVSDKGMIREANLTFAAMVCADRRDVVDKPLSQFIFADDRDAYYLHIKEAQEKSSCEFRLQPKEAAPISVKMDCVRIKDGGYLITVTDIAAIKKAEDELKRNSELLDRTGRIGKIGGWEVDAETKEIRMTEEVYSIYGIPVDSKLSAEKVISFFHPDDRDQLQQAIDRAFKEGEPYDLELRFTSARGEKLWTRSVCQPEYVDGKVTKLLGIFQDITERKKAEDELKHSKALLDRTGRLARVGGWELDAETKEVRWTDGTYRIHEVPLGQQPPLDEAVNFFHPDDRGSLKEAIQKALEHGEPYDLELRFITAKGDQLWTRTLCEPEMSNGKVKRLMGTFQDITDRKRAEEALREAESNLRYLFQVSPGIIVKADVKANMMLLCNSAVTKILGYSIEEFTSRPFNEFIHPDDLKKTDIMAGEQLAGAKVANFENRYRRKDGSYAWLLWQATEADEKGTVYAVASDITDRKVFEEALKKSEERYRQLVDNSRVAILVAQDLKIKFFNPAVSMLTGLSDQQLLDRPFAELIHPDDLGIVAERHEKRLAGEDVPQVYSFRVVTSGGETRWVELNVAMIDWEGKPATLNFLSDITEQKKAEAESDKWRNRYEVAVKSSGHVLYDWDTRTDEVHYGGAVEGMLGYSESEMSGGLKHWIGCIHPDDREQFNKDIEALIASKGSAQLEYRVRRKDDEYITVEDEGSFIPDEEDQLTRMIGFVKNITERKKAEEALQRSEERYRSIFATAPYPMAVMSIDDGSIVYYNDKQCSALGYSWEEMEGMCLDAFESKETPEQMKAHVGRIIEDGYDSFETQWRTKDGRLIDVLMYAQAFPIGDEIFIQGIWQDITSQKRAELALKESEEKYRGLVEGLQEAIYRMSLPDGTYTYFSDAAKDVMGYTSKQFMDEALFIKKIMHPDSHDYFDKEWQKLINGDVEHTYEYKIIDADGKERWIVQSNKGIFDANGKIVAIEGLCRNITERKKAETELLSARAFLDKVIDSSPFAMWIADIDGTVIRTNESLRRALNLTDEQIVGRYNVFKDANLEDQGVMQSVRDVFDNQVLASFSIPWDPERSGDVDFSAGRKLFINVSMFPIIGAEGKVENVVCQWVDITERKKAEEELKKYRENLEELVEEKTEELNLKVTELERYKDATVEREIRMKELRDRIAELETQSGE